MSGRLSRRFWFWSGLTVAVTAFILFHGSRTASESMSMSGWVMTVLSPLLKALLTVFGEVDWSFWIRKAAHVIEYAVLAFTATFAAKQMRMFCGRPFVAHTVLYVLVVAVTDEFIQGFVGRTSAVSDVLIDFGGALVGLGIAVGIGRCGRAYKRKGGTV